MFELSVSSPLIGQLSPILWIFRFKLSALSSSLIGFILLSHFKIHSLQKTFKQNQMRLLRLRQNMNTVVQVIKGFVVKMTLVSTLLCIMYNLIKL